MKKWNSIILFLFILVTKPIAATYNIDNINIVHLIDSTRYVCNPDQILNPDSVAVMDNLLHSLEKSTGIEVIAVAVEELETDCYDFALRLGQKYGVGKKSSNNGLVIVLSTKARCIQFATGTGLEGVLPDAICKRIQNRHMNGYLSKNQWDAGMTSGIRAVCKQLDGSISPEKEEEEGDYKLVFLAILFSFIALIWIYSSWSEKKVCPCCKKRTMKNIAQKTTFSSKWEETVQVTYRCSKCGHTQTFNKTKKKDEDHNSSGNSFGGPFGGFIGGGGLFGGGGGGSFGGGSFGGGGFGGGGSGSKF